MPQPGENGNFQAFHIFRLRRILVIKSQKMQDTMHHHMGEMRFKRFFLGFGFVSHRLEGDCHIPQDHWSGRRNGSALPENKLLF